MFLVSNTLLGQNNITVDDIYNALEKIDTESEMFEIKAGSSVINLGDSKCHINGIAYYNGYYYISKNRSYNSDSEVSIGLIKLEDTVVFTDQSPSYIYPEVGTYTSIFVGYR